ncbi:hypothetical protein CI102_7093 [Trichoderma harzianum]|uniref:Uncharacterized protein n=1 Tax=Trichoderma harzianum CBS 226.95 TaxID=983964 RepID=A0A2T4AVX5_TRIHA|nr:hypothetical protein M431DRAFT_205468 [Trichoderma harzianum CBS 226.95]PKK49486.1 hypothetical protein CI102_7093 [Trichoderma harzianum]PTB61189.1 hypothetical protein M431DRAFT_205468 [Trichoderma harzianum CBS 226.95]
MKQSTIPSILIASYPSHQRRRRKERAKRRYLEEEKKSKTMNMISNPQQQSLHLSRMPCKAASLHSNSTSLFSIDMVTLFLGMLLCCFFPS